MRRKGLVIALVVVLAAIGLWFAFTVSVSALDEPGSVETYIATKAKRWIVGRSARSELPPEPSSGDASIAVGRMLFGGLCASCHGFDGRTATALGSWMYPRVPDLGSPEVQEWSDAEFFWIIKHGIRLTGMPGFGNTQSGEEIWHLVHYTRTLGDQPQD